MKDLKNHNTQTFTIHRSIDPFSCVAKVCPDLDLLWADGWNTCRGLGWVRSTSRSTSGAIFLYCHVGAPILQVEAFRTRWVFPATPGAVKNQQAPPDGREVSMWKTTKQMATSGDIDDDAEMRRPEVKQCRLRAVEKMDLMMGCLMGFLVRFFGVTPSVLF